jgi:hypothetical protein
VRAKFGFKASVEVRVTKRGRIIGQRVIADHTDKRAREETSHHGHRVQPAPDSRRTPEA